VPDLLRDACMKNLLHLLAAIKLLVWGTRLVRESVIKVYGEGLRKVLAASMRLKQGSLLDDAHSYCYLNNS
jgi:phosphate:Na+ symporter